MANKRKSVSAKTRFEVFKRDAFKCQYCGKGVDAGAVLEVDHLTPVAEGGTNEIFNLVTACKDCNRGKGKTRLSDKEQAKREAKFLKEEWERLEISKLYLQWKQEIIIQRAEECQHLSDMFCCVTGCEFTMAGKEKIQELIDQFSFQEVDEAMEIAIDKYYDSEDDSTMELAFSKIGGICYNRRKQNEKNN